MNKLIKSQKILNRGGCSPEKIFRVCIAAELLLLIGLYELLHSM